MINDDFTTIDELLLLRGIDIDKYDRGNPIAFKRSGRERMGLYIQCFNLDPKAPREYSKAINTLGVPSYNTVVGIINNKKVTSASYKFDRVYLLASVDKKAWLLVENYLKDFATMHKKIDNLEGVTDKFYVSPRKFIVPAKVNIVLEKMRYSAWIPFGMSEQYPTFEAAKREIKKRLKEADLPGLKLTFKKESIGK